MRIIVDTNVLVRAATGDDPDQATLATGELLNAEAIVVPLPVLCELAWVLLRGYRLQAQDVADAMDRLLSVEKVVHDEQAAAVGLACLRGGGDFADGAMAAAGTAMGGQVFVTFDRRAARLVANGGLPARLAGQSPSS